MRLKYLFFSVLIAIVFLSGCTSVFKKPSADYDTDMQRAS